MITWQPTQSRHRLQGVIAHLVGRGRQLVHRARRPRSASSTAATFGLVHVADPHGAGSIVAVRGRLDAEAIAALHSVTAGVPARSRLYLDLTAASIGSGPWLGMLEALVDSLEARGVTLQVAGVSPHHPDLRPTDRKTL